MTSSYIRDFITSTLTERAAGVPSAPTASAPSPFDEEQRDRRFEKFRITRPDSDFGGVASGRPLDFYSSDDSNAPFTGQFQVGTLSGTIKDTFVGAPRELRGAMSTVGLATPMALGSAMSYKMLSHIEKKMLEGDPNYGLAMVNGRIVGVSPGIFGDKSYGFTGVLPGNLSHDQRVQLRNMILGAGKPLPYRQTPDYFPGAVDEQVGVAPPPEPTDEERAAAAGSNIVYDDKGNPVTVGGRGPDAGNYVTTEIGQYVDQAELQKQNAARQAAEAQARARAAAEEAARSRMAAQRDDNDSNQSQGTSYSLDSGPGPSDGYSGTSGGFTGARAKGGRVGMADGGSADPVQGNGFVEGSPDNYTKAQTVADDENRQVREGSFVLNAPTTEKLQNAGLLPKGVDNSDKNSTIKANKGGLMDVALSKGEYVIEPEDAQRIGYSFLEQLNNQGKAEVDRRQAARDGGFIDGYQAGGKTLSNKRRDEALADVELRADLEEFIREDQLARLGWSLYTSGELMVAGFPTPYDYTRVIKGEGEDAKETVRDQKGYRIGGTHTPIPGRETRPFYEGSDKIVKGRTSINQLEEIQERLDKIGVEPSAEIPLISYFAEPQYIPTYARTDPERYMGDRATVMITLAHELRHAALNYLHFEHGAPRLSIGREERLMDYFDDKARNQASEKNALVSEFSPFEAIQARGEEARYSSLNKEQAELFNELATEILEERGVPPVAQPEEKGYISKFIDSIFRESPQSKLKKDEGKPVDYESEAMQSAQF